MSNLKKMVFLYIIIISIIGCGYFNNSNELEAKTKDFLIQDFKKSGNDIEILSLEKTNGIESNSEGYKFYTLFFSAKFKVVNDYKVQTKITEMDPILKSGDLEYTIKAGSSKFIKTDNGWSCQNVEYNALDLYLQSKNKLSK